MSEADNLNGGGNVEKLREHKGKTVTSTICFIICLLPCIIAPLAVLYNSDENCNTPIRLWLRVYALVNIFAVAILILLLLSVAFWWNIIIKVTSLLLIIYSMFLLVWFILGNYWLFSADDCYEDFQAGYVVTFVILIVNYLGIIASICGCGCVCAGTICGFQILKKNS